ncbi:MAG: hypothetical protein KBA61_02425 [Spirochaetes bacterium]|nr:hypothetical protein [Spirochaetota bacterium]
MPSSRIIRVASVEDIDLTKVSVYDLNNRYVDSQGNMYGLKYNRSDKKIEVIKIIRTPAKSAGFFNKKVIDHRRGMAKESGEAPASAGEETAEEQEAAAREGELPAEETPDGDGAPFDADAFINSTLEFAKSHRDRLTGIMMNIKNSNVIRETNREEYSYMNDIFRNLDIDGVQRMEKLLNDHKELSSYPRSLIYYISKLDTRSKNIVDTLVGDSAKMRFVYLAEMFFSIRNLYRTLQKVMKEFHDFLKNKNLEDIRSITHNEVKSFEDGKISVVNTLTEAGEILSGCAKLENHIYRQKGL